MFSSKFPTKGVAIYRKMDYLTHARRFPGDNNIPISMIKCSSIWIIAKSDWDLD
jgi:hypothetical protein